ncbi:MAG: Gfo/Idh/MocA family oxidoreductase [Bacteroidales bacterium]|jgi:predicted dehydrogenase|nr:Gfo/Idh/MocA family oxidoreductase [Bacteroidales bacterium]
MKKLFVAIIVAAAALCACCKDNIIKTKVPARPAGQEDMICYSAPAIDTVGVGFVGVGMRGRDAVRRYQDVPWSKVVAICEVDQERADTAIAYFKRKAPGKELPLVYVGEEAYKDLCKNPEIDLVYICTDWLHHVPVAMCAMENGKHAAVEVPSAMTLKDCWDLVNMSEKTRKHCVILENCCYDFFELATIAMAREGLFGELVHAEGAYIHCLEPFWDKYWNNWRLDYNRKVKGDVYPTHGLGPVAQALGINRGDRFTTLVAMETDAKAGRAAVMKYQGEEAPDFQNGDLTCTLMGTAQGRTVLIEHDVMTPRPYNRMYQLVGTKGYAAKYPVEQIFVTQETSDSLGLGHDTRGGHGAYPKEAVDALKAMYPTPILDDELKQTALRVGGHGGMDFIMDYRLIYCLHYGLPVDMDVYDLATWCCLAELGSISINHGCAPVEVPDFTRGGWDKRPRMEYAFSDGSYR